MPDIYCKITAGGEGHLKESVCTSEPPVRIVKHTDFSMNPLIVVFGAVLLLVLVVGLLSSNYYRAIQGKSRKQLRQAHLERMAELEVAKQEAMSSIVLGPRQTAR